MTAEELGRRLLGECREEGLDEVGASKVFEEWKENPVRSLKSSDKISDLFRFFNTSERQTTTFLRTGSKFRNLID